MRISALWNNYNNDHRTAALSALGDIVDACRDAELGYGRAAEDVRDPRVKELFCEYRDQRKAFAEVLEKHIDDFGGQARATPTLSGRIHRKWMDVRSWVDHGGALGMLAECERGENSARARYEHALGIPMPPTLRDVLLAQLQDVKRVHDELDRLRGR